MGVGNGVGVGVGKGVGNGVGVGVPPIAGVRHEPLAATYVEITFREKVQNVNCVDVDSCGFIIVFAQLCVASTWSAPNV